MIRDRGNGDNGNSWPVERTMDILAETDATVVVIDASGKSDELAVCREPRSALIPRHG